jgi:hypothetical protein
MRFKSILFVLLLLPTALLAKDLAVTVYNNNLGVVNETRSLEFSKGINRLDFQDVPSAIDASSVRFEVQGEGEVTILEQNYAYDLVSPDHKKYIDKEIELIDKDGRLYSGTLLAANNGAVTLKEKSGRVKIILLENITEVNFPELPEGLITKPTLFWRYNSDISGERDCTVSYQTGGMSWSAEYVGVLDKAEKNLDLSGWASITNNSGKTYDDATLRLVAGDIHRAQQPSMRGRGMEYDMMAKAAPAAGFEEKAFFEYHLYTLPRKATLANREEKQISLFEPAQTTVTKQYTYNPDRDSDRVSVKVVFTNSKATGLGLPLPAGRVRLFKADDDGTLILLGEDAVKHTPVDEEMKLTVGKAFDIVAEQRLMEQQRISPRVEEQAWEIELRNRKTEAVTVEVEKNLYGDWELLKSSMDGKKKDANTLIFDVTIGAGDTTVVSFRVRLNR